MGASEFLAGLAARDENTISVTVGNIDRTKLAATPVTLNGLPAQIMGTFNPFATVRQNESGLSCEWAWEIVQRIVDKGGDFRSC